MEENPQNTDENPREDNSPKDTAKVEFKKPVLIGRVGKLPKNIKNEPEKVVEEKSIQINKQEEKSIASSSQSLLPPAVLLKELTTPIPYKEPKWSGLCPDGSQYALEVLKSGMIVENIDLTNKPYYVFGRLANSDIVMAHPTVSRHHCVLQYKAFAEEGEPPCGWYLYDLGSTHGTLLNKERLRAGHYTRVRVGHQIKLGASSRTHIVLGPDFDTEGETDLTVTEIKEKALEMKLERDKMIREAAEEEERRKIEEERKKEEQGIDWGMGEDADEEMDLSENPFAQTANEELYLTDPKKTLRGYFEREGHELTYHCDERGPGQFLCRVELPIDDARGRPLVAEVIHRGKKKEAVVACALEACRLLDRAGLLRQATHESRRRKARDLAADDFYDSDDDTFLDRTGAVERRRTQRMAKAGRAADHTHAHTHKQEVLTYDGLLKQISDIEAKISSEQQALERLRSAAGVGVGAGARRGAEDEDDLDAYMAALSRQGPSMATKADISRTKMSIQNLKKELSRSRRLAEAARPPHLPPLAAPRAPPSAPPRIRISAQHSVVYGKRIKLKEDEERKKKIREKAARQPEDSEFVEEVDSDDETPNDTENTRTDTREHKNNDSNINHQENDQKSNARNTDRKSEKDNSSDGDASERDSKPARVFGPMRPPEDYVMPESYFDQESDRDLPNIEEKE